MRAANLYFHSIYGALHKRFTCSVLSKYIGTFKSSRNITDYSFRNKNLTQNFFEKLWLALGKEKISTSFAVRNQFGTDEGVHGCSPADIVTYPNSVDDIRKIAKLCSEYQVPIIPHGAGTGLEHGVGAVMGGISVDLALLNTVIETHTEDFDCTVEAGITRKTLNSHLKHTGLMFPVDPGADASIGGMVSTSASGTNAVRYGTMKENVLNLEVVLADGSVLYTSGPNKRASSHLAATAVTDEIASCLPNLKSAGKIINRARSKTRPIIPHSVDDIHLTDTWRKTTNGEDFLLLDEGNKERILVFSTVENLQLLCTTAKIFLDGTFKVVPRVFCQLYTIHGIIMGQVFPLIFCLLPNKKKIYLQ